MTSIPNILPFRETILLVAGAGLLCHLVYKKTETHEPSHAVVLLLVLPLCFAPFVVQHVRGIVEGVLITLFIYWTTLLSSVVAYRLSPWHPLAQYPGPLGCKVTKFWCALIALGGKQHVYYSELHKRYGDVVRVGPNELSVRDVNMVVPLMGPSGLPKGPFWDGRIPEKEIIRPMISIRNKADHTRRRRPWTRAFSTTALKDYEEIITRRSTQLVEHLGNQKGVIDLAQWIAYFSYDFSNDLAFGGGSEMMRHGDVNGLWHILEEGQVHAIFMSHVPWLGALAFRYPMFVKEFKAFRSYAQNRGIMRHKLGSQFRDLYHHLMDEGDVATTKPTIAEAVSDGGLAIIAGSDTTSTALANMFFFLLSNPDTYRRLQAEIDSLGEDIMDYNKQPHLPYLSGAINESLRLYPPVLSGSQRAVGRGTSGQQIGPYYVAEGTSVFIPTYSLHRDPRYFSPLPDGFVPERWLGRDQQIKLRPDLFKSESAVNHIVDAFIPFSLGPSGCVGKTLAWMEMRMVTCLLFHNFEMELEKGYDVNAWHLDICDYFVMKKGKLPIKLSPRR
ncbi:cytochrome P450 [Pluteus cervinus]|uniref:Cytochrome P450 n=1 Tax=Pluteus cervinus TaxID=181527 RepID=A0ACD3B9U1_9AGAR|nr:cytochrome P450 [Pluteus cervinus]